MKDNVILNKLLVCAYVIIALLVINTFVLIISNIDTNNNNNQELNNTSHEQENTTYDVSMMDSVDVNKVIKLYDSKEAQVIYIGRETCGYCVQFLPTLQRAQSEYGYTTKYLDINTVTQDDKAKLLKHDNSEKFLENNFGATPMVLIVKNGKLVGTHVGYTEYDTFANFLEQYGFKK